ncbi:MAG: type II toxin-antitoxin system prevent-host-death family antitoxin [Anaerolineales bacterium]|nr:type II toxin-antitoxin system prevent-host-death family antitoxin [Anaerolineales bacterium]
MLRTTTVSELRAELASFIKELDDGPIVVLSRSRPAAVLVEPEMFDALLERCEFLEDILDGRRAIAEYLEDRDVAIDAEEVFARLGL